MIEFFEAPLVFADGGRVPQDIQLKTALEDLALAQDRLREAREALWAGLIDQPAFDAVLRRYEAAAAIVEQRRAELREWRETAPAETHGTADAEHNAVITEANRER